MNGGEAVTAVKENQKTKTAGKQSCSSSKGIKKVSPDSLLTAKKTRGRGKSVASHASMPGSSKSLQKHLNEDLLKDMAGVILESGKFQLGCSNDIIENSKEEKSYKRVKKASEFLFTPSRTNSRKEHDETIVPSSPDGHLDASRKTTLQPNQNKGNEWRKKVVSSSSASEEEKPSDLNTHISSDKDKTLQKMKPIKRGASSKKKQMLPRHSFILN